MGTVRPADQSRSERGVTSPRVATGRAAYSIGKAASNIALEYGAIIDKYIGDAIMVLFGDPESKGAKEDGRACVRMAVFMLRRLRELQAEWQELGAEKPFPFLLDEVMG